MSLSGLEYLRHILDEAAYLVESSRGLTREAFIEDGTLQRAFVRSLEIVGEAAKHVGPELHVASPGIDGWPGCATA